MMMNHLIRLRSPRFAGTYLQWASSLVLALLLLACGDKEKSGASLGPCDVQPPRLASCGQACTPGSACGTGLYCSEGGVCTADCLIGSTSDFLCAEGQGCSVDGRCGVGNTGNGMTGGGNNACADVNLTLTRPQPNIVTIVDQSGSMTESFGNTTRWEAVRNFLIGPSNARPGGLIYQLQNEVRFGLALYAARASGTSAPPQCVNNTPRVQAVLPTALGNYDAIRSSYQNEVPQTGTPTGESIARVRTLLQQNPPTNSDPIIFILATDGDPDTCANGSTTQAARDLSVAEVQNSLAQGIRTYVVSVGAGTVSTTHLQALANAGVPPTPGVTNAPYWVATDPASLTTTIRDQIIAQQISCTLTLNGQIQDLEKACMGTVLLNGTPLTCNDTNNGWRANDARTIELLGEACTQVRSGSGANVSATFPCGVASGLI